MQHLIQYQQERQQDWLREQQQAQQVKLVTKQQNKVNNGFRLPILAWFVRTGQLVSNS